MNRCVRCDQALLDPLHCTLCGTRQPAPTEAVARRSWGGIWKAIEEMGEALQVLGKIGPFPDRPHPDGGPPLHLRLQDEAADVLAAMDYLVETNSLDKRAIADRRAAKLQHFREWGLTGVER